MNDVQVYDGDGVTPYEKDLREKLEKVSKEVFDQIINRGGTITTSHTIMIQPKQKAEHIKLDFTLLSPPVAVSADAKDPVGSSPGSCPALPS